MVRVRRTVDDKGNEFYEKGIWKVVGFTGKESV